MGSGELLASQLLSISTAAAWSMMFFCFFEFLPAWCSFSAAATVVRLSSM